MEANAVIVGKDRPRQYDFANDTLYAIWKAQPLGKDATVSYDTLALAVRIPKDSDCWGSFIAYMKKWHLVTFGIELACNRTVGYYRKTPYKQSVEDTKKYFSVTKRKTLERRGAAAAALIHLEDEHKPAANLALAGADELVGVLDRQQRAQRALNKSSGNGASDVVKQLYERATR